MSAYAKTRKDETPRLTPEEYLERERKAETRSEYHGGLVIEMSGASWEHGLITNAVGRSLGNQLEDTPCVVITNDLRVRVPECDKFYYPDILVACETPKFYDGELDTLLNPTLLIEVLSDSTEATDRGEKWRCYQTLESLQTYVLISQYRPMVETYRRSGGEWLYAATIGLESAVSVQSVGCELKLADVYRRIRFDAPENERAQAGG